MEFVVGDEDVGERLDVVVARLAAMSRSEAARLAVAGHVTVDGRVVAKSRPLGAGEVVAVSVPTVERAPAPPLPPVRHRDDDVAVLAKPAGLVVHAGAAHVGDTLVDALREAGFPPVGPDPERPGIVHRLDRDTSGLLLVACSERAHASLVDQLRARTVGRTYLAVVGGAALERARLEGPIGRDPGDRTRFAVVADGKPSATTWEALARLDGPVATVLACRLETGRTHQIRVHASAAGHPVAGDDRYGGGPLGDALGLPRMFLHAVELAFDHPVTGERHVFREPLPDDLAEPLERAGVPAADLLDRL